MIHKKLEKIAGYLLSLEFDYQNFEYHATAIFPVHWRYIIPDHLEVVAQNNTESLMFRIKSKKKDTDEIINYIEDIVKANLKIDHHNQKLREKFEAKKKRMMTQENELADQAKKKADEVFVELQEQFKTEKVNEKRPEKFGQETSKYSEDEHDREENVESSERS